MLHRKHLPWEYGVRNLLRRPTRSLLTLAALTVVIMLVLIVVGFIRGLENTLAVSGDDDAVLVYSLGAESNIENSAIPAHMGELLGASLQGIATRADQLCVSPEMSLGTRVRSDDQKSEGLGLVRGVTATAPLVRRQVRIVEGNWPQSGEILVGNLVSAKLGWEGNLFQPGETIHFENRDWKISGRFAAGDSAFESEIWCRLPDLQEALKRQDISLVAMLMKPETPSALVDLFCKERTDLELQSVKETEYFASLQRHYKPVMQLAWLVVFLVTGAGIFAGLNMMYGAVTGRIQELATLQAIGFRRRAVLLSLIQEAVLLSAFAALIAGLLGTIWLNGIAVRFTMGAFTLRIDSVAILIGSGTGLLLGIIGAIPPAFKALRLEVAESLKAI